MAEPVASRRADATESSTTGTAAADRAGHRAPASRWQQVRGWLTAERLWVCLLGLGVLAAHDVGYMLRQPFWNDEAWVALTTRFPVSQLRETTSSTPIGWSLLLRLVTDHDGQTGRLLTLVFAALAVGAGYWLARGLAWPDRFGGVLAASLAGVTVLLAPAMLLRDDLKQYTADVWLTLLILVLVSRLERDWSRRNLGLLAAAAGGGLLLSDTVVFVAVAAFAAVLVVQLARRQWRRFGEAAAAGAVAAVVLLGLYRAFDAKAAGALGASTHWDGFYVPAGQGVHASVSWLVRMIGLLRSDFGLGPSWLAVPLVLAGLVTVLRLGRPATALAGAALLPALVAASALKLYPFGDLRTSTWLIVTIAMFAAIGVAGIVALLRSWLPPVAGRAAAALLALAAVAGLFAAAAPDLRSHSIPPEDVRDQATYVAAHARPGDVILVNLNSNWGFAYYWPHSQPARRPSTAVRQGYVAVDPDDPDKPRIVVAPDRDVPGVRTGLAEALAKVRPGSCATIWLVRSHVIPSEQAAWTEALKAARLTPEPVGDHGLSRLQPAGAACR